LAADGREGLARFDPRVHQAVFIDFLMPGLTGLEVAAAIRARGCMTPIVMISGCASPDDQRRAVEAGLHCVCKPITFAQFEAMMAEVVEHAGAPRYGRVPVPRATFPCPLCREVGRAISLKAELEPEPPLEIVTDLHEAALDTADTG
jgi:DNA-binding response OmpR family regulator